MRWNISYDKIFGEAGSFKGNNSVSEVDNWYIGSEI